MIKDQHFKTKISFGFRIAFYYCKSEALILNRLRSSTPCNELNERHRRFWRTRWTYMKIKIKKTGLHIHLLIIHVIGHRSHLFCETLWMSSCGVRRLTFNTTLRRCFLHDPSQPHVTPHASLSCRWSWSASVVVASWQTGSESSLNFFDYKVVEHETSGIRCRLPINVPSELLFDYILPYLQIFICHMLQVTTP